MSARTYAVLLGGALLAGCAGSLPEVPIRAAQALPDQYSAPSGTRTAPDMTRWWRRFHDPALTRIADAALAANQDIAQAAERLVQAEARSRAASAARLPTLTATFDPARTLTRPAADIGSRTLLSGEIALGWDPDLFGRLGSAHDAARAELAAAGYDLATVQRAVVAEVARNYIAWRALSARLANAHTVLAAQRTLLDVLEHRYEAGIAVAVDVERARLQLYQVEALLPALADARTQAANRIAVLIGRPPGHLGPLLDDAATIPNVDALPATGVPADLLRRRPDLRAAEERIAVAAANAGVARADLYPQLSLGGVLSAVAFSIPSLIDSLVTSVIGRLGQTLFDGSRRRALLDERNAATREALAAYRAAILTALEEVENALSATRTTAERVRIGEAAYAAAQRNAALTRGQYEIGLTDLFILLDAEQQALAQSDELIVARADRATAQMQLMVALGGGW
jgi:NodT family efflux transporter outer membrane factor (OMF) lipoprotein